MVKNSRVFRYKRPRQNKLYIWPSKKVESNKISGDSGHFIRAEIENTDFKKENLSSKIRTKSNRKPYQKPKIDRDNTDETVKMLEDIAKLEPGKNAQIAAKKISEKYKLLRAKKKFKLPGEVAVGDTIQTKEGEKIKLVVPPPKISSQKTAKRIKDKYKKIRRNKIKSQKIVESNKKNKILKETDTIEEIKTASNKKRTKVAAQKILKKYKNLKRPKKPYLVIEKDIDYIEPQEDLFAGESIVNAVNKVLDFEQFKKEQEREF